MDKINPLSLACAMLLPMLSVTGCSDETTLSGTGDKGRFTLDLNFDPAPLGRADRSLSRDAGDPITAADLSLVLTHTASGTVEKYTVATLGESHETETGNYTLEASYGDADVEDWESPYYYGTTAFTIKNQASTPVSLSVGLANAKLHIKFSEAFTSYLTDTRVTVTTPSLHEFEWTTDESRDLYVHPGQVIVTVTFTKPNGKTDSIDITPDPFKAQHGYTINIDADYTAETLELTIDDNVDETKEITVDISDANLPLLENAPTIIPDGFTSGSTINMIEGETAGKYSATIVARGKIRSAVLTTASAALESKGFPASVDLCNPGPDATALASMGLASKGLAGGADVFGMVDLTPLIANIPYVDGADNTSKFTLTVTDLQGKVTGEELLTVNVEKLVLEYVESEITADGKAFITVRYNGSDPSAAKFTCRNTHNQTVEMTVTSREEVATGTYKFYLESGAISTSSASGLDVTVAISTVSTTCHLTVPSLKVDDSANNAFSNYAYATVKFLTDEAAASQNDIRFKVSTDGGLNYTTAESEFVTAARSSRASAGQSAVYRIKNLRPGTTYTVRAINADTQSVTSTFTTETQEQIPNGDLDTFSEKDKGNHWNRYSFEGWGTNNEMTTKDGGDFAYVKISGTIPTNDSHSGSAVLLRTCGWGSGNSATGSSGTSGSCKYTDPGLLHLGSERTSRPAGYSANDNKTNGCSTGPTSTDDLDPLGIAFTSRPSSMSFYYKYSPKNSNDKGSAEITLLDASGNSISTSTLLLELSSSYKKTTVSLNYSNTSAKAAKIYVKFLSSYDAEYIKRTNDNFSGPGFGGNLGKGTFMGSELYIDDIELNY